MVVEALHAINLNLQANVVTLLAQALALRGAKHITDCESHLDSAALLPRSAAADVKTLIQVPENCATFSDSLDWFCQSYQSFSDKEKIELTSEVRERVRLAAQRLGKNRRLMESILSSMVPNLS